MNIQPYINRFAELDRSALVDPHTLSEDRQKVLWVLAVSKDDSELAYLTPSQIANILCDAEGIHMSRQRAVAILNNEKGRVTRRRINGGYHYKIMKMGLEEIQSSPSTGVYVDPAQAFSQIRKLEEILATLKGDLQICDPYIDNRTLDFLAMCANAQSISLLTSNLQKSSAFRRDLAAFKKEHLANIEVRVLEDGIHDRYIIHKEGMLLFGTSMNSFAKKQSFLVNLGQDIKKATESAYNRLWSNASKWA